MSKDNKNTQIPGVPTSFRQEFSKKYQNSEKAKKLVKVYLHSSYAVQIPLQFDDFFQNSNFAQI